MALGSILGGIATAGASALGSKLFGGSANKSIDGLSRAPSVNINAGGLKSSGGTVTSSAERRALVDRLSATFPEQAALFRGLRDKVAPGFGALTTARVDAVNSARQRSIGNLRDNLQRRRVLGSSFGQDAVLRGEAEFAKQEAEVRAQSFMEELNLSNELIGAEYEAARGEFQTFLDEFNIQANAALQIASGQTAQLGQNQRLQAQIAMKSLEGIGKQIEPLANSVGKEVASIFSR